MKAIDGGIRLSSAHSAVIRPAANFSLYPAWRRRGYVMEPTAATEAVVAPEMAPKTAANPSEVRGRLPRKPPTIEATQRRSRWRGRPATSGLP